jgi:ABC-2 type transport system ATP-binding protein
MNIVEIKNLTKCFKDKKALDNISLVIPRNSIFGFLGPNGAGKTTTIRILTQIILPDSGEVYFDDRLIKQSDNESIGYLPEERGLYKKMKVGEHAIYLATLKGLHPQIAKQELLKYFRKFEMLNLWNKTVEELSKGMQQKLHFIIAIVHRPRLLILDEPFSGLDPINAQSIIDEMIDLNKNGCTIILSTHNMESVENICQNLAFINQSRILLNGTINDIKQKYKSCVYEIGFKDDMDLFDQLVGDSFKIILKKKINDENIVHLKSNELTSHDGLLNMLFNKIHISTYREILPSIHDIFIEVIKDNVNVN